MGADLIIVLKNGVVVEQGTHESLLAAHGTYYELWRAQQDHENSVIAHSAKLTA